MLRYFAVALCAITSARAKTHEVRVGWSGSKFTPNITEAEVGDIVEFKFYPPDHSVVRAHYENGCVPFESMDPDDSDFYSGPQVLSAITDDLPTFRVEINHTDPIFFYCGAEGSCTNKHMIGAINPNKTQSLEGHLKFVEEAEFQRLPGEDWPSEAPDDGEKDKDKGKDDDGKDSKGSSGLSAGAIAGIAIGGAAVLIIAAALIYLCGRRGGKDFAYRRGLPIPWGNGGRAVSGQYSVGGGVEAKAVTPMSMGHQDWAPGPPSVGSPGFVSPGLASPGYAPMGHQQAMGLSHHTGASVDMNSRYSQMTASPPPPTETPLVELPGAQDPGHSPLPAYQK